MTMTSHAVSSGKTRAHRPPVTVISLIGLLSVLAVGAIQGGIEMTSDPVTPLSMPTTYLERTPIDTYFWPGVFLLAIAAASIFTIAGLLLGWRWRWAGSIERAIGFRWPWIGAIATGTILLLFEIIELFMVPFHPVMHPLLIAGSVTIVSLTLSSSARSTSVIQIQKNDYEARAEMSVPLSSQNLTAFLTKPDPPTNKITT